MVTVQTVTPFLTLAFDLLVFVLTLFKTYRHGREMRRFGQTSIADLLLRDG